MGSDPESFSKSAGFSMLRWRKPVNSSITFYSSANLSWIYVSSIILVLISSLLRSFVFMGSDPESFSIITKAYGSRPRFKGIFHQYWFHILLVLFSSKDRYPCQRWEKHVILTVNMTVHLYLK